VGLFKGDIVPWRKKTENVAEGQGESFSRTSKERLKDVAEEGTVMKVFSHRKSAGELTGLDENQGLPLSRKKGRGQKLRRGKIPTEMNIRNQHGR